MYPDEDICLFEKFPHQKLIYPFLNKPIEYTCTALWLLKNTFVYKTYLEKNFLGKFPNLIEKDFQNKLESCNFTQKFKNCHPKSIQKIPNQFTYIRLFYEMEVVYFFEVNLLPLVSLIGLGFNLINILVLQNVQKTNLDKSKKKLFNRMHSFMYWNSVINFFYVAIHLAHMINMCVTENAFLCSSLKAKPASQYFSIYLVDFLGNFLKILSNLTMIGISFIRFLLLNENYFKIFKKFRIFKSILAILFLALICALGAEKILTNQINTENYALNEVYDYVGFPDKNTFAVEYEPPEPLLVSILYDSKISLLIFILHAINFVLNDLLFLILFVLMEFLILFKVKSDFKKKLENIERLRTNNSPVNIRNIEVSYRRISFIIVINSTLSLVFRLMDFAISTILAVKRITVPNGLDNRNNLCLNFGKVCLILDELNEFIFIISISYTTIIYFFLNQNFKKTILKIFSNNSN